MKRYFIGIDNGGTVSKAALFDQAGNEIAAAWRYVDVFTPKEGWSERNATAVWNDTASAIREVIIASKINPKHIACVACTGHGNGLYLIDQNGDLVRNAINSNDERAIQYIQQWKKNEIDKKALPMTAQSLWAAQPNALLSWIRDNEPSVFERIGSVLMAKDFIRYKLTGETAAEITDMSATSLMNVVSGVYDDRVLRLFSLEEVRAFLPPLVESTDVCGWVTPQASVATGIPVGTAVAAGVFDIDACALSSGVINSEQMSIVAGTWGNNQYISKQPLIDKDLFMTSRYAIPQWYIMLEGSPTSTGNMQWITHTLFKKEREEMGDQFFDWVSCQVDSLEPNESDVIFLPFIYGNNCGASIKSGFYGLSSSHTSAHLLLALFEGVVFSHYQHYMRLMNFRDQPQSIRFTGGAARSAVWCQMFADCIGIPLEIPKGSELGAFGAAITAMTASEKGSSLVDTVNKVTAVARRYEPNKLRYEIYQNKYQRYQKLISLLVQM